MEELREKIRGMLAHRASSQKSGKLLPLMMPTFGEDEILEALDSMLELQVTMGKKVEQFEHDFSAYLGAKHATMVNSGSSANLLALTILSNPTLKNRIKPGDEVIVPAVTWSTSIFPIINVGAKPVLVDVDDDYLIDVEKLKESITSRTKVIMPVHLLGNVCDMDAISEIAKDRGLFVVEDCCEALGSEYKGRKAGNFSDMSTFSSYFSHHITTIEGGMLCTNEFDYADLSRIIRAHGYVRHSLRRKEFIAANPGIDPRFLFVNIGYNFRPTDLQGAFGIHQLRKLEGFLARRAEIGRKLLAGLGKYSEYLLLPREKKDTRHSWFVFPITVRENDYFNRDALASHLERNGIETRPLVCGNFAEQPAMRMFEHGEGDLRNAKSIMKNSFYFGVHPNIENGTLDRVLGAFDDFFSKVRR